MKSCVLILLTLAVPTAFASQTFNCQVEGVATGGYFPGAFSSFTIVLDNDKVTGGNLDGQAFSGDYTYEQANAYVEIDKDGGKSVVVNHDIGHDMQTLTFWPSEGASKGNLYEFIDCVGEFNNTVVVTCGLASE